MFTQNKTIKMKFKTLTTTILLIIGLSAFAQGSQKNFIDQPYIEVSGQFETEVIPDEIYLNIVINENDKKGKISIEKQENQLIDALKRLDIDISKNLSIQDFDGSYKKYFLNANKVTKIKRYQLLVSNGKLLGEVYQSLTNLKISTIYIDRISHSEIEKYKRETKIKALQVAKEKASEYANAIGQSIGKAIHIQESFNDYYSNTLAVANNVQIRGYASEGGLKKDKITNLNLQTIKLSATVQTKFILN